MLEMQTNNDRYIFLNPLIKKGKEILLQKKEVEIFFLPQRLINKID